MKFLVTGATGLILPRDRSVHVTPTVVRVSAGATEHLPCALVTNLARAAGALFAGRLGVDGWGGIAALYGVGGLALALAALGRSMNESLERLGDDEEAWTALGCVRGLADVTRETQSVLRTIDWGAWATPRWPAATSILTMGRERSSSSMATARLWLTTMNSVLYTTNRVSISCPWITGATAGQMGNPQSPP